ncbi:MAG: protein BatD [Firmicutes bacterium]|nr:protein BatD [Bacillota bacterium]
MRSKFLAIIFSVIAGTLIACPVVKGQTLSASAALDTDSVTVGETVELRITVEGTTLAKEPVIEAIDGLEISYLGPSTRVQIVNGEYSASIVHNYQILALKSGSYTLGPFELKVKDEKLNANSVTLQVNDAVSRPKSQSSPVVEDSPLGDKLFMEMELGKTRLYLGEKTPLKIKVYFSEITIDEMSYPEIDQPEFAMDTMNKPSQRRTTINGRSYQVVEFSTNLTPLKTGSFILGPAQLKCNVMIRQRVRDPFFSDFFTNYQKYPLELKSNQLKITALPLPASGKPATFSGGIGQFQIQVTGQPTEVLQGEPVTLKLTVTGNGNLQMVSAPYLKSDQRLKVYDVQKKTPAKGVTGQVQFEQVVIPLDPQVKQIGPFYLDYFDPRQGKYRQAVAPAIPVTVKPNPDFNTVLFSDAGTATERFGEDLVFIKEHPGKLIRREARLIYQRWFWWLQLLPVLLLLGVLGRRKYQLMLRSNTPKARAIRAANKAAKLMTRVKAKLNQKPENTLEQLHAIVREYLGEKYGLTTAGMTGSVVEKISEYGVDPETLREVKDFFEQYDYYRFTGNKIDGTEARRLWEKVNGILKALDRQVVNNSQPKMNLAERRGRNGRI